MNNKKDIIAVILIFLIIGMVFFALKQNTQTTSKDVEQKNVEQKAQVDFSQTNFASPDESPDEPSDYVYPADISMDHMADHKLPLQINPNPAKLPQEFEVYLISGYERGTSRRNSHGDQNGSVIVDRPGKNVVLVLNSQASVMWTIHPTEGTKIIQILAGNDRGGLWVDANDRTIPVTPLRNFGQYQYNEKDLNVANTMAVIAKYTRAKKVNGAYKKYDIDPVLKITEGKIEAANESPMQEEDY